MASKRKGKQAFKTPADWRTKPKRYKSIRYSSDVCNLYKDKERLWKKRHGSLFSSSKRKSKRKHTKKKQKSSNLLSVLFGLFVLYIVGLIVYDMITENIYIIATILLNIIAAAALIGIVLLIIRYNAKVLTKDFEEDGTNISIEDNTHLK